jgi:hypothetical protein
VVGVAGIRGWVGAGIAEIGAGVGGTEVGGGVLGAGVAEIGGWVGGTEGGGTGSGSTQARAGRCSRPFGADGTALA